MNECFLFYLRTCTTIHIITATVNKAVKEIYNCILHILMVLLPEIFLKILVQIHKFVLFVFVCSLLQFVSALKAQWKKIWDG